MTATEEPLKYDADFDLSNGGGGWLGLFRGGGIPASNDSSTPPSSVGSVASTASDVVPPSHEQKKLTFDDSVAVVPIPMRDEYSERVKERLWSSRVELHENAQRNAIEFASEGWDWRTVTEDEGMYRCSASGELVHPVHCQHPYHDD